MFMLMVRNLLLFKALMFILFGRGIFFLFVISLFSLSLSPFSLFSSLFSFSFLFSLFFCFCEFNFSPLSLQIEQAVLRSEAYNCKVTEKSREEVEGRYVISVEIAPKKINLFSSKKKGFLYLESIGSEFFFL